MQVCFEILKDEYYNNDSVKSLYQWLLDFESDREYQSYKRTMKYVRYYKEHLKEELSSRINVDEIKELNLTNMESVDNRLKGYSLNSFQFIQLVNIQKYKLLKVIIDKRICSNKKISNSKFLEMYSEIDKDFLELKRDENDYESYFKNMIHFYEIEKNYSIEMIYKIATFLRDKEYLRN